MNNQKIYNGFICTQRILEQSLIDNLQFLKNHFIGKKVIFKDTDHYDIPGGVITYIYYDDEETQALFMIDDYQYAPLDDLIFVEDNDENV